MPEHSRLIDTAQKLDEVTQCLSASPVIAIDTEFIRERTYYPLPCLLQVGTHSNQFALDVKALSPDALKGSLSDVLFDSAKTKILHAGFQDLEVIELLFGNLPTPIFDTQIAEAFLSTQIQIGYGALVEKYLHITLPKASSLTDWARRPLDLSQIHYALDDVRYLPQIYDAMKEKLLNLGRYSWVLPEFQDEIVRAKEHEDSAGAYRHIKRISSLRPKELAVAKEIATWREERAQSLNKPRRSVLADEVILSIARLRTPTPDKIIKIRTTSHLNERDVEEIARVAEAARNNPVHPEKDDPQQQKDPKGTQAVVDLLFSYVRVLSEKEQIAPAVLASKDDIINFIREDEDSRLFTGWRWEIAGRPMKNILTGQAGLYVHDGQVRLK